MKIIDKEGEPLPMQGYAVVAEDGDADRTGTPAHAGIRQLPE